MTGYGRAEQSVNDKIFLVELRSLNGKQYDIRLTIPTLLKSYEIEIRNMLNEGLMRGSIECVITLKQNGSAKPVTINTALLKATHSSSFNTSVDGATTSGSLRSVPRILSVLRFNSFAISYTGA